MKISALLGSAVLQIFLILVLGIIFHKKRSSPASLDSFVIWVSPSPPLLHSSCPLQTPKIFLKTKKEKPSPSFLPKPLSSPSVDSQLAPLIKSTSSTGAGRAVVSAPPLRSGEGNLKNPWPPYPLDALQHNIQGSLIIKVIVNSTGSVLTTSVYKTSGHKVLDDSALETLTQWRFPDQPNQVLYVPVQFELV